MLAVSIPCGRVTYNSTTPTTNYYNADGTLSYKIDANGQKISYDYDSLMRVTAVHRFPNGTTEDTTQQTTFEYDANSVTSGFSQNVSGRLAVSKSFAATVTGGVSVTSTFYEMYSYDSAGRVLKKRLRIVNPQLGSVDKDIEYNFTADKLNTVKYPDVNVPVIANPAEKFGTLYARATGLDYADQRFYSSGLSGGSQQLE